ncbi:hypothetical protein KCU67_g4896, partial [Aureobasidium melanogenum]
MVSTRSNTAAAAHTGNPATTTVSTIIAPPTYDSVPASDASAAQAVYVTNADGPPAATGPANNAIIDGSTPHVYASREEYVNQAAAKIDNKLEDINDKDEQIEYLKNALLSQHGISIDLCMKHNQKAHRLVQTIRDIRVRDLHVRVLNNRLHHMGLRTRRLITQAAALREQQDSHPYSTKINEWLSNNQIERIVLRPEGQASRSGTRITRAATSRDSRSGMMVQRLGAQVDGRRVTSRVNLEHQIIADLKAKLKNAEQYVEVLEHKHNAINISDSRLDASLTGSAAACLEIGHQIKHANDFRKSAVCIQSGLDQLAGEFYGIRSAFQDMEQTWSHPTGQELWTANATNTVKHAQHIAQDVAKALRDIVRQCDNWDVVVPDHSYYQLQAFEICLQRQELVLNLLGMVLYVASPCELPTYPFYKVRKSLEEMEREKLKYGCEQLAYAVRMRREMQVKLLKIASIDPEYKDIDMVEIWEKMPDTEEWPSPQTTMGTTTPTEDWSYLLYRDDTASGPMEYSFLPIPRAHPTKLVKLQQRKDTGDPTLEELLDNFGDGNKLGASYPIGELIKKYRQTYYDRLYNSVIGSAQACSRISGELLETSMQRQTACRQPALGLLQNEFHDMHYALRDLRFIVGTPVWHDNATITVRCVQRVCHQVVIQLRGIIPDNQIWKVIAPDHTADRLYALAITLQEQQMVLELLILVMAFFDAGIVVPSVIHQHRIYHHESKRLDNFVDGILEGVRAKRAMRQDILKLRSSSQQHGDKFSTKSSDELSAADTWSSSQSTLTLGAMTPIGDWSN